MTQHVIIGTAGHIDHGKTRLVGRLSNINTDRLPEEKARGISIDLGFAHWEADGFRFGIVDVPGHERFVKNMVAGATGVNLAMLVVAADDSVMPQTREHLEIMDLLGVPTGVVVVTKTDIVDPDFVELVISEVEEVTAGTFLEGCPIIPVSSETGEGIEELKTILSETAAKFDWPAPRDLFRMPIDRVFSITGHGTIATGTVLSGEVQPGDTLQLHPQETIVRVRSVQNHKELAGESGARQRTAINLAGIKAEEVERGNELAATDFLAPTRRLLVQLRSLSGRNVTIRHRQQLNVHIGTSETPCRVILKGPDLQPGSTCYAEIRLSKPVVAEYGQRYILRRQSPAVTVGGGKIIDPYLEPHRRVKDLQSVGAFLDAKDPADRLGAVYSQEDVVDSDPKRAAWRAGIAPDRVEAVIAQLRESGELLPLGHRDRPIWVHRLRLEALAAAFMKRIRAEVARHQPARALPKTTLLTCCRNLTRSELLEPIFARLLKTKELVQVGPNLGPADAQVKLTKKQTAARDGLLQQIGEGALAPPNLKALATALGQKPDQIETLLHICVEDGLLVRVSDDLHYSPDGLEQARVICRELLEEQGQATMSELREAWGNSRKYAVPICEYFDAQELTIRDGDVRRVGPKMNQPLAEALST